MAFILKAALSDFLDILLGVGGSTFSKSCIRKPTHPPNNMQIYLLKNGQQVGPYTVEVIRGMLSTRYVAPTDPAWHEGLSGWQPLNTFLPTPPKPTATFPAYAPARPVQVNVNQGARVVTRGYTSAGSSNSSPVADNLPSFIAAILMCIAFFMPWSSFLPISGSTMGSFGGKGTVLWAILIMAVITIITHFVNPNKVLNVVTGIIPLVIFIYFTFKTYAVSKGNHFFDGLGVDAWKGNNFFEGLGVGVWLTLACGITLIVAPVKTPQSA